MLDVDRLFNFSMNLQRRILGCLIFGLHRNENVYMLLIKREDGAFMLEAFFIVHSISFKESFKEKNLGLSKNILRN